MVLVSRAEKRAIHAYLLREGVIVVRKDSYLPQHQHIENVSNLKVQMIVKSLKSHGYLQEIYNWQWSYYLVTNRGVTFLAKALGKSTFPFPFNFLTPPSLQAFWMMVFESNRLLLMYGVNRCVERGCARYLQEKEDSNYCRAQGRWRRGWEARCHHWRRDRRRRRKRRPLNSKLK